MGRWRITMTAVVVSGVLAAGCGSGGGRTRAAFDRDANKLCDGLIEARTNLAAKHFPSDTEPPTIEQLRGFYAEFAPHFASFADGMAKVEPAKADQKTFDEFVRQLRTTVATFTRAGGDTEVARHLMETDEAEFRQGDLVAQLGIKRDC